ncbi:MAG: hypothetical protein COY81_04495 [Candidatus Pacebacteria bacterium CG_4_10_14_0_8_um_filter_43_12]|nr:MAG: hypothetical protein COU66_00485 [Candidatus Pacebacteria bacterium CG10_big_fil_rev_8_21_14_0_10_44_11]PIY79145.1 MAG: hypothetical protein COY81_04495 [Candidatus Pacebacteria bacterium CG_4_10_14_0_8_um_filter_43_12]
MKLVYSDHFKTRLKKRVVKNRLLTQKVGKQLKLLLSNMKHPSLKIHKLKGTRAKEYAIWIEGDLRITFVLLEDTMLLTDIITHDEY